MTEKIKDKAGLVFYNCPHFKSLRESDLGKLNQTEMDDLTSKGTLRLKTLDKKAEESKKKELKLKRKRGGKKNDPSIKKIREHLRKIIRYHEEKVQESIPSIYPILGPANTDSENDSDEGRAKKEHTKKEMKQYNLF